jgi:beta-galactosidase
VRKVININKNWLFAKQDEAKDVDGMYNLEHWETIKIPHTWNAIDGANGFDYYKGACWYRKVFTVETSFHGSKVFVEFKGSNSITDVYVNGQHIGQHRGGYSTFRFDISDAVKYGAENVLSVKVDNTVVDDVYPQKADFTFFGGIYRDVNIIIVNSIHFDLMDYGSTGIYVAMEEVSSETVQLKIKAKLVNSSTEQKKVRLWADILDASGRNITYAAKEVLLSPREHKTEELTAAIKNPTLWNGRKNPYMYSAKVSITSFNDTIDELTIPFGVRYFKVDSEKGFFLNGEHLPLHGVSRHQDRKDMGWAITKREHDEDMELIKEIGATSIRLAHYQHDDYFYDLCDSEGMVVWAEIPFISIMSKEELEGINAKQQMLELIRQNYNRPSIMFWGIQNEIQIAGERPEVRRLVKELNELTKTEDPSRLSTMANVLFVKEEDEYNRITDVVGYNKYYGWYNGKAEDFAPWLDKFHRINPDVPLCVSEYGAEGIVEYHSKNPKIKDYTEEYHALFHETVWKIFEKRPFLWATYVWNMFDFGANIRDEGGVKGRNNKGLVTYDRKIKKDAFYMYKAHWSEEKFVHIASKRFIDRADDEISVKIYSNCSRVTLYVNGNELSTKVDEDRVLVFDNIPLAEGINEITAVAEDNDVQYTDTAFFNNTSEPNLSYVLPEETEGEAARNWFQMPDLEGIEIEEIIITDDVYSTRCTFRELLQNKEADEILVKYLGSFKERPTFEMTQGFTLDTMADMAPQFFTEKLMYMLNKELTKIKKNS